MPRSPAVQNNRPPGAPRQFRRRTPPRRRGRPRRRHSAKFGWSDRAGTARRVALSRDDLSGRAGQVFQPVADARRVTTPRFFRSPDRRRAGVTGSASIRPNSTASSARRQRRAVLSRVGSVAAAAGPARAASACVRRRPAGPRGWTRPQGRRRPRRRAPTQFVALASSPIPRRGKSAAPLSACELLTTVPRAGRGAHADDLVGVVPGFEASARWSAASSRVAVGTGRPNPRRQAGDRARIVRGLRLSMRERFPIRGALVRRPPRHGEAQKVARSPPRRQQPGPTPARIPLGASVAGGSAPASAPPAGRALTRRRLRLATGLTREANSGKSRSGGNSPRPWRHASTPPGTLPAWSRWRIWSVVAAPCASRVLRAVAQTRGRAGAAPRVLRARDLEARRLFFGTRHVGAGVGPASPISRPKLSTGDASPERSRFDNQLAGRPQLGRRVAAVQSSRHDSLSSLTRAGKCRRVHRVRREAAAISAGPLF